MKIVVVTCYQQNDYIRARTLRTAFRAIDQADVLVIRNSHKGFLRYPEVFYKLLRARFTYKPDAYVITFRGYETLLFMRLFLFQKTIIFDELINFTEWMVEHNRFKHGGYMFRLFRNWNAWATKRCRVILADTDEHARYSSELNRLSSQKYLTVPVCADETVFKPRRDWKAPDSFEVLYYGSMLPLHGLSYLLEAARQLKDNQSIRFRIVGGKSAVAKACEAAGTQGANVVYDEWVPFEDLPGLINQASLAVGGPFGNTLQSQYVITGKAYQFLASAVPTLIGENKVTEKFIDRENCLLVPQADAGALAEAIRWAYDNPDKLEQIGDSGYELYKEHFSQAQVNRLVANLVATL
jgi:glycosyltransferase involved in cell wall biosynthesis